MLFSLRRAAARVGRWPRLAAAGICLLLAAASALGATRPTPEAARSAAVVVAARDLPAGHRLIRDDLAVARWPPGLAPPGARADPRSLVGAVLAGPITRREALTPSRLLGPELVQALPAGTVASVVVVDQDVGYFVRAGDHVTLLAAPREDVGSADGAAADGQAVEVAARLIVLAEVSGAGVSDATGAPATSLVLGVVRAIALRIAQLRAAWAFSVVAESP